MCAISPTPRRSRPERAIGSESRSASFGRSRAGDVPFANVEDLVLRNLVVEEGLLEFSLLRHLAIDLLSPSGLERDAEATALFLEQDRGLGRRFQGNVPFAHRAAARELDAVEDAAHRRLGMRSEEHTSELQSRVDLVCRL